MKYTYEDKVRAIQEALKQGVVLSIDTFIGILKVGWINEDYAYADNRSWAICSTEVNQWFEEIKILA